MKIIIDTHYCSREELAELKEYLEEKCWDFRTDEKEEETKHCSVCGTKYTRQEDLLGDVCSKKCERVFLRQWRDILRECGFKTKTGRNHGFHRLEERIGEFD